MQTGLVMTNTMVEEDRLGTMRALKAGRSYTGSGFHTLDGHTRNIDRVCVISRALARARKFVG